MLARPQLEKRTIATVKPVTATLRRRHQVPAYLTLPPGKAAKNLPAVVLPHGGPSSRDEWGFDWLAQFFAARGYAVLQPNYRGSAGFGDDGWWITASRAGAPRSATSPVRAAGWSTRASPIRTARDRRLVLRRLCRASGRSDRAGAVQGGRRDRAGHRPRLLKAEAQELHERAMSSPISSATGPHIERGLAAAPRRRDQGAGAARPRRPRSQRRRRAFA